MPGVHSARRQQNGDGGPTAALPDGQWFQGPGRHHRAGHTLLPCSYIFSMTWLAAWCCSSPCRLLSSWLNTRGL